MLGVYILLVRKSSLIIVLCKSILIIVYVLPHNYVYCSQHANLTRVHNRVISLSIVILRVQLNYLFSVTKTSSLLIIICVTFTTIITILLYYLSYIASLNDNK